MVRGSALAFLLILCGVLFATESPPQAKAEESTPLPHVLIGFDGEYSHPHSKVPDAIEKGILTAIDEINEGGGVLGGHPLKLVVRDNHAVPARAAANIEEFALLPELVAVFSGKYSPSVMECIHIAQERGVILLDPWAAQREIVDNGYQPNYVFRLSLRDDWALQTLVRAIDARGIKALGILLPMNSWGRSIVTAVPESLAGSSSRLAAVEWYNWGSRDFTGHYRRLLRAKVDGILLVADVLEGQHLIRTIRDLPPQQRRPVFSHWGITGGHFFEAVGRGLEEVELTVVQTFSFAGARPDRAGPVLRRAEALFGKGGAQSLTVPAAFAQAYDLTHILARAIALAKTTTRSAVRDALEQVPDYSGLVRDYRPPFTPERHEALGPEQVYLARYGRDGTLQRIGP